MPTLGTGSPARYFSKRYVGIEVGPVGRFWTVFSAGRRRLGTWCSPPTVGVPLEGLCHVPLTCHEDELDTVDILLSLRLQWLDGQPYTKLENSLLTRLAPVLQELHMDKIGYGRVWRCNSGDGDEDGVGNEVGDAKAEGGEEPRGRTERRGPGYYGKCLGDVYLLREYRGYISE
ncbi:hypothetical protein K504DRAFT_498958 [Pleomassaria siparia CBS 279.74]|uniref:Uncharacterized protein n=1 Tax=Pleomassaria siparia CBS 279.74 TaxID=1314801 RepID=A0A6G1KP73_9PLEO|nr:hypothetical protein K504DRAFT_498958 [Pleomassaria siparia CBS 279.74]